jgi:hypothetical protein
MSAYSNQTPFDPSMLVHFRERIDMNLVNRLNQKIVKKVLESQEEEEVKGKKSEVEDSKSEVKNRGKLILDASCAPADISYPTDLGLLNQARKHTEIIIDILYNSVNFNESGDLKSQVEAYKNFTGYYPESVHVDKIYRNRDNRDWCKERGIRISGPPLGRPPKNVSKETKKQAIDDERIRNSIEGKFGQGKRRFSLGRVMTKLPHTSLTSIAISFLVMNLSTLLSRLFWGFFCQFFRITSFFPWFISEIDGLVRFRQQKLIFISA